MTTTLTSGTRKCPTCAAGRSIRVAPTVLMTTTRQFLDLPAAGTATKASEPQHRVLAAALAGLCDCGTCVAYIARGDLDGGKAPLPVLTAMARRGFVRLDKDGFKVRGAWVTELGVRKFAQLEADEAARQQRERNARGW